MTCIHCGREMLPSEALELTLQRKGEQRHRVRHLHRKAVSRECFHGYLGTHPMPDLGRTWRPAR